MRLIIQARIDDGDADRDGATILAVVERRDRSLSELGLTLAESRALLAEVQSTLVSQQVAGWICGETDCRRCGSALCRKESRSIVLRTVFGKVTVKSPRLWSCTCQAAPGAPRRSISPLCTALPRRVTPELEYLQVKWAAHLPYRAATALLREVLPLDKGISFSGTRQRIRVVGKELDAEVERDIATQPKTVADEPILECGNIASVSVDSAWLRHCEPGNGQGRHVNIVAGRATFVRRPARLYAYVHKEVRSAAGRLDQFLSRSGVERNERVTVISDDAGEFIKAVDGSQLARGRILDWFHIAMEFKAVENSVFGSKMIEPLERASVESEIRSAKWLVWHGKGGKAVARIKLLDEVLMARADYEFSTLWWNLRRVSGYIRNNANTLVNYAARHRRGLPISSSIAESAVNLVVSHRMAKKRHMRWSDEGAHCMAQVRVAALNGDLSPARLSALAMLSAAGSPRTKCRDPLAA